MKHTDYVHTDIWYAWHPVKTTSKKWVWLQDVERVYDKRDEVYIGLLPRTYYNEL